MSKIIDFGKFGKIDVHKESFNFDYYKIIVPGATVEMFNELKSEVKEVGLPARPKKHIVKHNK